MHAPPRPVVCTLLAVMAVLGDRAALKVCSTAALPEPRPGRGGKRGRKKRRPKAETGGAAAAAAAALDYDVAWRHLKRTSAVTPALLRRIADFHAPTTLTAGRVRRVEHLLWAEDLDEDTARFTNLACRPLLAWCNSQIGIWRLFHSSSEAARGRLQERLACSQMTTMLRAATTPARRGNHT